MRAYHVPDLDGLMEAIVAAPTLAVAADALGMTVRTMRERGWRTAKGAAAATARKDPTRPIYRSIVGTPGRWTADRSTVAARAARAVLRRAGET